MRCTVKKAKLSQVRDNPDATFIAENWNILRNVCAPAKTIYVEPDSYDEQKLRDYFSQFGTIESCKIELYPFDVSGVVTFRECESVDKVLARWRHHFSGHHCNITKFALQ